MILRSSGRSTAMTGMGCRGDRQHRFGGAASRREGSGSGGLIVNAPEHVCGLDCDHTPACCPTIHTQPDPCQRCEANASFAARADEAAHELQARLDLMTREARLSREATE